MLANPAASSGEPSLRARRSQCARCDSKKTVIELDCSIHDEKEEYDQFRDEEMKLLGLHVQRLKNEELSEMNIVIEKIIFYLNTIV